MYVMALYTQDVTRSAMDASRPVDRESVEVPKRPLTQKQLDLRDRIDDAITEKLGEREEVHNRIKKLRDERAKLDCPYDVYDILKRKGDRSWYILHDVTWSGIYLWKLHVAAISRTGNYNPSGMTWLPGSQENLRKFAEYDPDTKQITKV